jgi:hypothetical protein
MKKAMKKRIFATFTALALGAGVAMAAAPTAMASDGTAYTLFGSTGWGNTSYGVTARIGLNASARVVYNWSTAFYVSDYVCTRARGYNSVHTSTFYGAGCGEMGSVSVPWGNVASVMAFSARHEVYQPFYTAVAYW